MKCPYCSRDNTRVVDSRPVEEDNSIRRRRVCDVCSRRFTTYEKIETIPMIVIKKDNNRETYDRSKIEGGILRACHKRPVSMAQIRKMVYEIETEIFDREEKEIDSKEIGEMVMDRLHDLDPVAYVRFASVYREFKDVETFMDELKKVLNSETARK
jgi:transcriptional repressor NrdR